LRALQGAAAVFAARPAHAAYGEAANVFGSATNTSGAATSPAIRARQGADSPGRARARAGFVPYAGDGYAMLLPGKWNPSKEREFAGMDVRCVEPAQAGARRASRLARMRLTPRARRSYEDNFDAVNTLFVLVKPAEKSKMEACSLRARPAATAPFARPLTRLHVARRTTARRRRT
jgi:hypothetical protein